MPPMTRAQGHAYWAGNPSLCDLWIASTLRALAMLVSNVARLFRSAQPNQTAECDGSPVQTLEANDVLDQPGESKQHQQQQQQNNNSSNSRKEQLARGDSIEALMVSSTRSVAPVEPRGRAHRRQPRAATTATIPPPRAGGRRKRGALAGMSVGIRWGTALTISRNLTAGPPPDSHSL